MLWLAALGLHEALRPVREAGMAIGLIADLAIGMDGSGSHAWSRRQDVLEQLTVGAPPDVFNPAGQSWGLAAFSPRALRTGGFTALLATLRAAMRHAGGVRIDHIMGLTRLWLVPEGASPADGAYLAYPVDEQLRLVALESHRHQAVVIGEDLGTVPPGFRPKLDEAGILGMRVLWFERGAKEQILPAARWSPQAASMTTTHDLPTVAGWWSGTDIAWRKKLDRMGPVPPEEEDNARATDRKRLWRACTQAGTATGDAPLPEEPARAVDAALAFTAATPCELTIVPLEDALALREQPNLPGTIDEHPNWRRRTRSPAATLLDEPDIKARLAQVQAARSAVPAGPARRLRQR